MRRIRDHRTRTLQTLFGTVKVDVPRLRLCACVDASGFVDLSFTPLSDLLPDRCTPELRRLQAELGARHSFREAARLLTASLPCSPANHASVRYRLHRIGKEIDATDGRMEAAPTSVAETGEIVVLIYGAHIRAAPGYQSRHLDVTVGKVEAPDRRARRLGLSPRGAEQPLAQVRAALVEQGWQPGRPVTVISDGEAALPNLVQAAIKEPVTRILDWFHISTRVRRAEQTVAGLRAMEPMNTVPLDTMAGIVDRARHLLWNGYHEKAGQALLDLHGRAGEFASLNGEWFQQPVKNCLSLSSELRSYICNNADSIISYHRRYHAKRPVSTSRAEGCVDEIANARMAKRRRTRWSPIGAHRVAQVRAAVLDDRLSTSSYRQLAD
jgi:hypothetical protein